jgi:NAD(P)H-dependent FMN reductase
MPRLLVVIATTRPGRVGAPVGRWFTARARALGAFDVEVVDLADLALPFYDEPHHPRLRRYTRDHTRRWSARVDAADAFVFVTAEYNHAYPATLKNALDFLHHEWRDKPLGFVSYGGVAAGTRAVVALEPVVTALRLRPVPDAVNLPFVTALIGEDGELHPGDISEQAARAMLDELARTEAALRPLRAAAAVAAA